MEITYVRINEKQYATNLPRYAYHGSIEFPYCLYNPNGGRTVQNGVEVYQVLDSSSASPRFRVVYQFDSGPQQILQKATLLPAFMEHPVLYNETLAGNGSTQYAIHIWNQILVPEPIHRQDRWFNITFIPYHPGFTAHEEGEPCSGA